MAEADTERLPPVLTGKKALVVGVANEHSIAWGCAAGDAASAGAEIAMTYLNERAKPHVEPLAQQVEAPIFLPLEVRDPAQVDALFDGDRRSAGAGSTSWSTPSPSRRGRRCRAAWWIARATAS